MPDDYLVTASYAARRSRGGVAMATTPAGQVLRQRPTPRYFGPESALKPIDYSIFGVYTPNMEYGLPYPVAEGSYRLWLALTSAPSAAIRSSKRLSTSWR